jgi:hypothetical protein
MHRFEWDIRHREVRLGDGSGADCSIRINLGSAEALHTAFEALDDAVPSYKTLTSAPGLEHS